MSRKQRKQLRRDQECAVLRETPVAYRVWGEETDPEAVAQMENAARLPVAVRGALMPDAHLGYGLPIGGVLATDDAVIPYAVGVDIACRMKLSVLDWPVETLQARRDELTEAIEQETAQQMGLAGVAEILLQESIDEELLAVVIATPRDQ